MKKEIIVSVKEHYDRLIDENNDPVHDSAKLQEYMNQWDGEPFLNELNLTDEKTVLEIGIGTGRLAAKTSPLCKHLVGIDISSKTVERARQNLDSYTNIDYICADFTMYQFAGKFDVIYSSLTWLHIKDKYASMRKVAQILNPHGRFVISIDKSQKRYLDYGNRKIEVYPDTYQGIKTMAQKCGLSCKRCIQTEFAYIFSFQKQG